MSATMVHAPLAPCKSLPFAALPHELRRDRRLNTRAVVAAAALLEYARDKADCWVGNARLASDMGCTRRTVQIGLWAAGWIAVQDDGNPTGRRIVLTWRREADCTPPVKRIAPPR